MLRPRNVNRLHSTGQSGSCRTLRHKVRIRIGLRTTELVIYVGDVQAPLLRRRKVPQDVQQGHGVRPT